MTDFYQITTNEIISGICTKIHSVYGQDLKIYKEKRAYLDLPSVTVYCIDHSRLMERYDRFTNIFNIIINYYPEDSVKINNKRLDMYSQANRIMECIRYIPLPAYKQNSDGKYEDTTLLSRASDVHSQEQDGFIQISATYTVRTKYVPGKDESVKLNTMECSLNLKQ